MTRQTHRGATRPSRRPRWAAWTAAAAIFLSPLLPGALRAQEGQRQQEQSEQEQDRQGNGLNTGAGLQVAVPQGRNGGGGRGGRGGRGREAGPPPAPAPRNADGRVTLTGLTVDAKGVWLPGSGGFSAPTAVDGDIPFQAWAAALLEDRRTNQLEPHTRCKPSGGIRQFLTPYGVEIVELPELQRVYIFDIGGPHTFRTIYMDGRSHPSRMDPTFYGHSIGWWEGDTLVVDTRGFNEGFWIDRAGLPTTSRLHTLERFTRVDAVRIDYSLTIDDPGAYTRPWTSVLDLRWEDDTELFEYVCQQANYAHNLMVGAFESVDRTTVTVP